MAKKTVTFKAPKIKVGKKLPKNLNLTKVSLRSKKIHMPNQVIDLEDVTIDMQVKNLLEKIESGKDSQKYDALCTLLKLLKSDTSISCHLLNSKYKMSHFIKFNNLKLLDIGFSLLSLIFNSLLQEQSLDPSVVVSLWSSMRLNITHINSNLRIPSINFLKKNINIFTAHFSTSLSLAISFLSELLEDLCSTGYIVVNNKNCHNFNDFFNIVISVIDAAPKYCPSSSHKINISFKNVQETNEKSHKVIIETLGKMVFLNLTLLKLQFDNFDPLENNNNSETKENLGQLTSCLKLCKHVSTLYADPTFYVNESVFDAPQFSLENVFHELNYNRHNIFPENVSSKKAGSILLPDTQIATCTIIAAITSQFSKTTLNKKSCEEKVTSLLIRVFMMLFDVLCRFYKMFDEEMSINISMLVSNWIKFFGGLESDSISPYFESYAAILSSLAEISISKNLIYKDTLKSYIKMISFIDVNSADNKSLTQLYSHFNRIHDASASFVKDPKIICSFNETCRNIEEKLAAKEENQILDPASLFSDSQN